MSNKGVCVPIPRRFCTVHWPALKAATSAAETGRSPTRSGLSPSSARDSGEIVPSSWAYAVSVLAGLTSGELSCAAAHRVVEARRTNATKSEATCAEIQVDIWIPFK